MVVDWSSHTRVPSEDVRAEDKFTTLHDFIERHKGGTEAEFNIEKHSIDAFNEKRYRFDAWTVALDPGSKPSMIGGRRHSSWLFLVDLRGKQGRLPDEGDYCKMQRWIKPTDDGHEDHSDDEAIDWWHAERTAMPHSLLGSGIDLDKYGAFRVTVISDHPSHNNFEPILDLDENFERTRNLQLLQNECLKVMFRLRVSVSTRDAELSALRILSEDRAGPRRRRVFEYCVFLRNPAFFTDLGHHLPHVANIQKVPQPLREKLEEKHQSLDLHQATAYTTLLQSIPCGVCLVPGGPGAGKTTWNLYVAARAQAVNSIRPVGGSEMEARPIKILYLIDINKPLGDIASRMVKLYERLGMKKRAVRMYSTNDNLVRSGTWMVEDGKLETENWITNQRERTLEEQANDRRTVQRDYENKPIQFPDFSLRFIQLGRTQNVPSRARTRTREACLASTLDEAAWAHYENNRNSSKYLHLRNMTPRVWEKSRVPTYYKYQLAMLYRDVLDMTDFIATTPVAATKNLIDKNFSPDLVFFDEAPHAREASTLISVARFDPVAWIFTGDPRQTLPFVKFSEEGPINRWRHQLERSMMARADALGVTTHSLLINHRAYANLHKLPSSMFYDNKMETAFDETTIIPTSTKHLMKWMSGLRGAPRTFNIPRFRVSITNGLSSDVVKLTTSPYNKRHMHWVLARVEELVNDPDFKQRDGETRGTILILSPYKEAYFRYRLALREMMTKLDEQRGRSGPHSRCLVEARTVNTTQGHEADVIFLDLVQHKATSFLEDKHRLCVAISRARQAEFIMADDLLSPDPETSRCLKGLFSEAVHTLHCAQAIN